MSMPPDIEHFSQSTLTSVLWAISLIVTAMGVPQLFKSWREIREMKYTQIAGELDATKKEMKDVKQQLYETKDALREISSIVSILLPMIKMKTNDPELITMIKIFEARTGINITTDNGKTENP